VHGQPAGACGEGRSGAAGRAAGSSSCQHAVAGGAWPTARCSGSWRRWAIATPAPFSAVRAHSPREDVVAAAAAARACRGRPAGGRGRRLGHRRHQGRAGLPVARAGHGGGDLEPYRSGAPADRARPIDPPADAIRMLAVSTTLSAPEFTAMAGITDGATNTKQMFVHRLMVPRTAVLDPAATLHTPEGLLFSTAIRSVDHAVECWCSPLATPATEALSLQGLAVAGARAACDPGGAAGPACAHGGAVRHVAGGGGVGGRRADGCQPRHRLRAGRGLQRAARPHLVRDAAGGAAVERKSVECRSAAGAVRGHGAARRARAPVGGRA
jgi:hypothetical protein